MAGGQDREPRPAQSTGGREARAWRVHGRVQGVGFRYATRAQMAALELIGEAVNRPDGSVHVTASGTTCSLDALERWLWRGPRFARVDSVERGA